MTTQERTKRGWEWCAAVNSPRMAQWWDVDVLQADNAFSAAAIRTLAPADTQVTALPVDYRFKPRGDQNWHW